MKETARAAAAYAEYAAMGPDRSLAKLAEKRGQSAGKARARLATLERWSAAHNWQARVKEYDAAAAVEMEARRLASVETMNQRQAELGVEQTRKALDQIAALMADSKFGSQAAVMLLKLAIDTERTARGAPASVQRQEVTGKNGDPIEHSVTDDRRTLLAFLASIIGQRPASGSGGDAA